MSEEKKDELLEDHLADVAAMCHHYMGTLVKAAAEVDEGELTQDQLEGFLTNMVEALAPTIRKLPDEPAEWYAVGFERIGWNVAANRPFPRQGVEGVDTMEVVQWLDKAYNQAIDADEEEESLGAEEKLL